MPAARLHCSPAPYPFFARRSVDHLRWERRPAWSRIDLLARWRTTRLAVLAGAAARGDAHSKDLEAALRARGRVAVQAGRHGRRRVRGAQNRRRAKATCCSATAALLPRHTYCQFALTHKPVSYAQPNAATSTQSTQSDLQIRSGSVLRQRKVDASRWWEASFEILHEGAPAWSEGSPSWRHPPHLGTARKRRFWSEAASKLTRCVCSNFGPPGECVGEDAARPDDPEPSEAILLPGQRAVATLPPPPVRTHGARTHDGAADLVEIAPAAFDSLMGLSQTMLIESAEQSWLRRALRAVRSLLPASAFSRHRTRLRALPTAPASAFPPPPSRDCTHQRHFPLFSPRHAPPIPRLPAGCSVAHLA